MFYSPFDICNVCKQYVLLDQTKMDCAREHECQDPKCPLERFFAKPVTCQQPGPDTGGKQA